MFKGTARARLHEKLHYELWLLRFLPDLIEPNADGCDPTHLIFRNKKPGVIVNISGSVVIGAKRARRVVDAMLPFIFVTCCKTLDMVFEWILEENYAACNIGPVPWRFGEKVKRVRRLQPDWFPPLMQSEPYLRDYLIALYGGLLDYRGEIAHGPGFDLSADRLTIAPTKGGKPPLDLDRDQLTVLTKVAVAAARFLIGEVQFGPYQRQLLKHDLDRIQKCHNLPLFADPEPVLENVLLIVPAEAGVFRADLAWLREQVARRYRGKTVFFNLEVLGTVGEEPQCAWRFPYDEVPEHQVCEFRPGSHAGCAVSPTDIRPP